MRSFALPSHTSVPWGEAREAHQRVELLRLRIHQHLPSEARAELRDAYGPGLADDGVVVPRPSGSGGLEDAAGLRVVQRYLATFTPSCPLAS